MNGITKVDIKVIGVAQGVIPSEVAQWTYEVKPNIQPILVQKQDNMIRRAERQTNVDEFGFEPDVLKSGGGHSTPVT